MAKHVVTLYKYSLRHLDESVIRKQMAYAIQRALGSNRGKFWMAGKAKVEQQQEDVHNLLYVASIRFQKTGGQERSTEKQWSKIQQITEAAIRSKGWSMQQQKSIPKEGEDAPATKEAFDKSYANVSVNVRPEEHFSHLYDRESQVAVILSAIEEYTRSEYNNRFHTLLYGDPACGKTDILRSVSRMVGPDAVLHFDATSTTKAGAQRTLLEAANVPPILCIEEIEKTDEQSLRWLLGVLDYRAEIRKNTYRGSYTREVKLLCLATANDYELFTRIMDGALASRFSHKVYCPRPSREVLKKILEREILTCDGKAEWIEPALDWCLDEEKTNDPRRIITVCLSGRDALLDESYQKHLRNILPPS